MRAISAFSLLAGMSTRACLADTALRMRASMSEIGSVIFVVSLLNPKSQHPQSQIPATSQIVGIWRFGLRDLPAALRHARHVALERQLAETEPAHRELAHVGAWASAEAAAVPQANPVFGGLGFLGNLRSRRHLHPRSWPLAAGGWQ